MILTKEVTVESVALEMGDAPFGSNLKNTDYTESGVLVVQGKNIQGLVFDWSDKRHVSIEKYKSIPRSHCFVGDLLFPKVGTIGKVGILSPCDSYDKYLLSTNTMRLKVDPAKADPYFIYYYFTWSKTVNLIKAMNSKSVQPVFNYTSLKKFPLQLPDLNTQTLAAQILKGIDDKIILNTQTNQTLEAIAQAIFKSWFVDFDPVKAKMNGEQPVGMDEATAALFPDKLVESELGLIPEGWDVGTLGDVAQYCSSRISIRDISLENYISTENMLAEKNGVTTASKLPIAKMIAAYKTGDILVSNIRPYFKKIWLAEGNGGRSNDVLGFKPKSANTSLFLLNLLYQDSFFEYMTRTAKGAKMPRGDKTAIMNWEVAVPPEKLREAFSISINKIYQLISQNRAQNESLGSLRNVLLPKLLSGEIALGQAEQMDEASV